MVVVLSFLVVVVVVGSGWQRMWVCSCFIEREREMEEKRKNKTIIKKEHLNESGKNIESLMLGIL